MAIDALAWEQTPAEDRTAIERALLGLVAKRASTNPWSSSDAPTAYVIAAKRGPKRMWVQFVIDHYIYCVAQSGSDWAQHQIWVGHAVVEGTKLVDHAVETALDQNLRESDSEWYRPSEKLAAVREAELAKLRAPRTVRVTRCPECGSTDAGEVGGIADIGHMKCQACGHERWQDNYQIYDDWEVPYEYADAFDEPPPFLPPLPASS